MEWGGGSDLLAPAEEEEVGDGEEDAEEDGVGEAEGDRWKKRLRGVGGAGASAGGAELLGFDALAGGGVLSPANVHFPTREGGTKENGQNPEASQVERGI